MENIINVNKNNISFLVEDSKELHQAVDYNFWSKQYSHWEPRTFEILDSYLFKDKDYLDIGAWVGPTAIYGSFLCKNVVAIEPDPVAYRILNRNISINNIKNIEVINKAASSLENASLKSCSFYGDSMSRVSENPNEGFAVETIGFDVLVQMGDYSLIKIDIEGHEFDLIPSYKEIINEIKVPIYISLHSPFVDDSENKLNRLLDCFATVKNIFDEEGNLIKLEEVVGGFGSYLFTWK